MISRSASSVISAWSAVRPFASSWRRTQVAPGDLELLVLGVAGEADHLHAVAQRPGDGVEHVGGRDEDHPAEVERHAEVVVAEGVVLLGVEHLEHRRGRVALDAAAELVDLVEHHHAVARAGLADRLDDVAGQRADIGAPVAADLGLVVHAAEADAHELPAHRARDRLAERGLADAGRADEAEDRRLALRRELADRQELDDALLIFSRPKWSSSRMRPRLGDVDRLLLGQPPGQLDQPVEIGADHAGLGGGLRHALVAAQLLAGLALDLLGHAGLGDRLRELGDLLGLAVALAELALDRGHLLAQHRLALALVEGGLGLPADLVREAQHLDPLGQQPRDLVHALR